MPLFDFRCPVCDYQEEFLVSCSEPQVACPACAQAGIGAIIIMMHKLPPAVNFKIKGLRAANGYGLKSIDTYGKNFKDEETGVTFSSNRGATLDHTYKGE